MDTKPSRRRFLTLLAAVPVLGRLVPKAEPAVYCDVVDVTDWSPPTIQGYTGTAWTYLGEYLVYENGKLVKHFKPDPPHA